MCVFLNYTIPIGAVGEVFGQSIGIMRRVASPFLQSYSQRCGKASLFYRATRGGAAGEMTCAKRLRSVEGRVKQ